MSTNTESNKMTSVKTIYARAAVLLLALNFCLTGYVVVQMSKATQEQIEGAAERVQTTSSSQASRQLRHESHDGARDDGSAAAIKTQENE